MYLPLVRRPVCIIVTEHDELQPRPGGVDVSRPFGERHVDPAWAPPVRVSIEWCACTCVPRCRPPKDTPVAIISVARALTVCSSERGDMAEVLSAAQLRRSAAELGLDLDRDVMDLFVSDMRRELVAHREVW